MNPEYKKWDEITDKIDKLSIIQSVEMLTGYLEDEQGRNDRTTIITVHPDVKFKGLKYTTFDLEDMFEELEVYYLKAKNKDNEQKFIDGVTLVWNTYKDAMILLWSLIFWGILGIIGYVLWLTPMGAKIIEMAK